ncbi:EamA family transporter RarD [Actinacidiphila bryophytorum]|uniref:Protein RarD n=1 Tax=Actinacidiphila bryophytorum TaxID=1436133 RepID=A0A9W4GWU8_9ACTN|nr:EamA family transporter RarD [Actinacidiphila bryophytorum]MBM9439060.1 EamA family transporter RarD [Actinacidiphila bryophytorum]MBN6546785.1 EamA family transporter RarD [Actinacidiphila bryophytorum]CAG7598018.1 Protein RarD [Actinacidiphila bryophytorum]
MGENRAGLVYGFAAYGLWGLFPLYWPLLEPAGAGEILAHRMVWSLVVVAVILLALRRWAWIADVVREPRRLALLALAATVVSVNWGMYIWAVNAGHVVETSLGYFINPLVTIALAVLVLHERLRRVQWAAVGIGAVAVAVLAVGYGRLPWIALTLALSFGTYGLVKKKVAMGGLESLAAETSVQFLPALAFLLVLGSRGDSTFTHHGPGHAGLLALSGLVTAVPLVCFGMSANRLPLSTLGLLQYLAPVFQFLIGILHFHETMSTEQWIGFLLVWSALVLLTADAVRNARRTRAAAPLPATAPAADAADPAAAPAGTP